MADYRRYHYLQRHLSEKCTKRSMILDCKGVPRGITVDAADRHNMKMTKTTLQSIVVDRPEPTARAKQPMCMDKGYDYPEVFALLEDYGYTIHIRLKTRIGKQTQRKKGKDYRHIDRGIG